MKRIFGYYMETGKTINESLVKRIIEVPAIETWSSLIKESVRLNKERMKK